MTLMRLWLARWMLRIARGIIERAERDNARRHGTEWLSGD
jgi:hypothetical protein